jgi:hypothetical protein
VSGDGCLVCGAGRSERVLICRTCTGELRAALGDAPWLLGELDVTLSRQGSQVEHLGTGGESVAMPFDDRASEARNSLVVTLRVFTRLAWQAIASGLSSEHKGRARRLAESAEGQAMVLAEWQGLPSWHMVRAMHDAVTRNVADARSVIDRPQSTVFVGWCSNTGANERVCGRALYVPQGEPLVKCPSCGRSWDVATSRASLLLDAHDALAPAATLSAALGVPSATIRSWRRRGKLTQATDFEGKPLYSPEGRPLYRLSDVRALALAGNAQ